MIKWDIPGWFNICLQVTNVGEDKEEKELLYMKKELLYIYSGDVNCCSHYGKQVWRVLKKLKMKLSYAATIPLLGIYLKKQSH